MGKVKVKFSTNSILKKIDEDNLKKEKKTCKIQKKGKKMWGKIFRKKNKRRRRRQSWGKKEKTNM